MVVKFWHCNIFTHISESTPKGTSYQIFTMCYGGIFKKKSKFFFMLFLIRDLTLNYILQKKNCKKGHGHGKYFLFANDYFEA